MRCGFYRAALLFQFDLPPGQFFLDRFDRRSFRLVFHHIMCLGINRQAHVVLLDRAEQGIDLRERFDLVAEHFDAVGHVIVGGIDFDDVAAHAEGAAAEIAFAALVENVDQLAGDVAALDLLPFFQEEHHAVVGLGRAEAVDAADRGDDQAVAALEERARGREAQLVELVVDGRFFFDVEVGGGNVGLGLVEVVIGDEVFDRIVREEILELVVELGGQSLVVRHHDASGGWPPRSPWPWCRFCPSR